MSDDAEVTEQLATASSSAPFVRRMRDSADVLIKWMPETLVVTTLSVELAIQAGHSKRSPALHVGY